MASTISVGQSEKKYGNTVMDDIQDNGLFIFPTHAEEWSHNKSQLQKANKTFPVCTVEAMNNGFHALKADTDHSAGLLQTLYLCCSAKVHLTSNLFTEWGLFNGASGTVVDIKFENEKLCKGNFPIVFVNFPKYSGPPFIDQYPTTIPIVAVSRRIDCNCCSRTQIPLRLGWGTTIHRCQGLTIGHDEPNRYIVISPGSTKFESLNPGALYVSLSTVKSTGNASRPPDFAWHPNILVNEDRLCHKVKTSTTKDRDLEIQRLKTLAEKTKEKRSELTQIKAFQFYKNLLVENEM